MVVYRERFHVVCLVLDSLELVHPFPTGSPLLLENLLVLVHVLEHLVAVEQVMVESPVRVTVELLVVEVLDSIEENLRAIVLNLCVTREFRPGVVNLGHMVDSYQCEAFLWIVFSLDSCTGEQTILPNSPNTPWTVGTSYHSHTSKAIMVENCKLNWSLSSMEVNNFLGLNI